MLPTIYICDFFLYRRKTHFLVDNLLSKLNRKLIEKLISAEQMVPYKSFQTQCLQLEFDINYLSCKRTRGHKDVFTCNRSDLNKY